MTNGEMRTIVRAETGKVCALMCGDHLALIARPITAALGITFMIEMLFELIRRAGNTVAHNQPFSVHDSYTFSIFSHMTTLLYAHTTLLSFIYYSVIWKAKCDFL